MTRPPMTATLERLLAGLADPDPAVRDDGAMTELAELLGTGALTDADCRQLGAALVARLAHPEIAARSFAALALAALLETGTTDPDWVATVCDWYVAEDDRRGWDDERGWLHAAAHGADYVAVAVRARALSSSTALLTLTTRLTAPTTHHFVAHEDDRIARALLVALGTGPVDAGWLDPVRRLFAGAAPGPVPPQALNTIHALRSLLIALWQQPLAGSADLDVADRQAVAADIVALLHPITPWLWRPVD